MHVFFFLSGVETGDEDLCMLVGRQGTISDTCGSEHYFLCADMTVKAASKLET